jgi:hypothetical protein
MRHSWAAFSQGEQRGGRIRCTVIIPPSVRSRRPICLNENRGGPSFYKENGEKKEEEE